MRSIGGVRSDGCQNPVVSDNIRIHEKVHMRYLPKQSKVWCYLAPSLSLCVRVGVAMEVLVVNATSESLHRLGTARRKKVYQAERTLKQ